jgi:uncharacterized protein YeaO (DUF488 family)
MRALTDITWARIGTAVADGRHRVLVDRLWPRGVRREEAPWEEWLRDVAPSTALRQWYGHDPARFEEFRQRYRAELAAALGRPEVQHLLELARARPVMLLTATRDLEHSQAPVLAAFLREVLAEARGRNAAGSEAPGAPTTAG